MVCLGDEGLFGKNEGNWWTAAIRNAQPEANVDTVFYQKRTGIIVGNVVFMYKTKGLGGNMIAAFSRPNYVAKTRLSSADRERNGH